MKKDRVEIEDELIQEYREKKHRARSRQVQRKRKLLASGMAVLFAGLFIVGRAFIKKDRNLETQQEIGAVYMEMTDSVPERSRIAADVSSVRKEYLKKIENLAQEDERYLEILEMQEEFPDGVLRLCANNGEALEFVLAYPEKKGKAAAETIGEVTKGEVPLLIQWDEKWGYASYGNETIVAVNGCGPACVAMVVAALTGRNDVTPAVVAEYSAASGFLTNTNDTSWDLMNYGCEVFGISGRMIGLDENVMANELYAGHPIIASMGPGDFTSGGHLLVISGYDGAGFEIKDPNSILKSQKTWTFEELKGQIKNLWAFQII